MTEQAIAIVEEQPKPLTLVKAPLVAGSMPRAIVPVDFDGAYRIANVVVAAGMAPKTLQSVEKAMVAILHGLEVGLTPMNALQSIAVINGRPTIWGDGAIGLIRASGLLEYMQERFEGEGDKLTAVCIVKRKGEKQEVRGEFSWSDVLRAKLNTKEGPWQTYPRRMMQMRARWPLRDVFADVLKGLSLREEVEDMTRQDVQAPDNIAPRRQVPSPPAEVTQVEKKSEKPTDSFPGDKPKDVDPLDIPPELDRRQKKAVYTASESLWLSSLKQSWLNCETKEELDSVRESEMYPSQDAVSDDAWNVAESIYQECWEKISG